MSTIVGSHPAPIVSTPVDGDPLDPSVLVAHFNNARSVYNDHDGDAGIHVQSGAAFPGTPTAGDKWILTGTNTLYIFDGVSWHPVRGGIRQGAALPAVGLAGELFVVTPEYRLYQSDGAAWVAIDARPSMVTSSTSGAVAVDGQASDRFNILAIGNITSFAINNPVTGRVYEIIFQSVAGTRTVAAPTNFDFGAAGWPGQPSGAGVKMWVRAIYDGSEFVAQVAMRQ